MNSLYRTLVLMLLAIGLLGGCASTNSTTNVEWQAHQQRLASITHYANSGKLGYISPEQRQSLNFHWQHSQEITQLRLTTFLGQTVLNLRSDKQGASVDTYDGESFFARSPQALINQLTGLAIPVEQLNQWMLGNPTNADHFTLNQNNTLASLSKRVNGQEWQLQFNRYQDLSYNGVALPLPRSMKLIQGDTSINISITQWTIEP